MSLLGTMADALDGNASCGWVACRNLNMSLGGHPCSWSTWGVSSVRSCASWTRSSATALDKSARLCVFSHVSTSANVMAQVGRYQFQVSRVLYPWCVMNIWVSSDSSELPLALRPSWFLDGMMWSIRQCLCIGSVMLSCQYSSWGLWGCLWCVYVWCVRVVVKREDRVVVGETVKGQFDKFVRSVIVKNIRMLEDPAYVAARLTRLPTSTHKGRIYI